jgi:hypothetical protein
MSRAPYVVYRPAFADNAAEPLRPGHEWGAGDDGFERDARPAAPDGLERHPHEVHRGKCPICKGLGPVDVHRSYVAWSILLVPFRTRMTEVCCRSCGVKLQVGGIVFSTLFGLWGIPFCWVISTLLRSGATGFLHTVLWESPFGSFLTPLGLIVLLNRINFGLQVLRNLGGIMFGPDAGTPSDALKGIVKSRMLATVSSGTRRGPACPADPPRPHPRREPRHTRRTAPRIVLN